MSSWTLLLTFLGVIASFGIIVAVGAAMTKHEPPTK